MRNAVRLSIAALLVVAPVTLVLAQSQPPPPPDLLMIYREEVRPGKGGAHEANEKAWAAAYAKAGAPITWLAMTSLTGPSEAWFISGMDSYADLQKMDDAFQASPALTAESQKFSAQESDILSRTSAIIANFQPALSYGPPVSIPEMRYMRVEVVQVRPGYGPDFSEAWRSMVAAHEKGGMKENWATYAVATGMPTGTFLFFYPLRTLGEIDGAGPMHAAAPFRDAVGERGRAQFNQLLRDGVVSQEVYLFAFKPAMSLMPKEFTDRDPKFWAPAAAAPASTARKPGDKP